jgi:RNA polymerase sigma-70 factor (ECF subfamily)
MTLELCSRFRACLGTVSCSTSDLALEQALQERLRSARLGWPNIPVSDATFVEYLAARSSADALPAPAHAADLLLACACAAGDEDARTAFHDAYAGLVTRVLRRRGADPSMLEDLKQAVLEKLLLAAPGERPRIAEYRGRAPLKSWVATVTLTTLLMARRSQGRRREQSADEDEMLDCVIESGPELRYLKQHYRKPVESAIVFALGQLADRDRVLLRLHLCQRMSIDQLGVMYGVNRATAARWLASARGKLLETTCAEICRGLRVSKSECDSILNLVQSQLDVSVARHLSDS